MFFITIMITNIIIAILMISALRWLFKGTKTVEQPVKEVVYK